jgi:DNA-3-methyladenine glycosylase
MFGPVGHLYVYFTYGMHYCCNVVAGEEGYGAGALIRAVEPLGAFDILSARRGGRSGHELTNGPAKLCQALGITTAMNGHDLTQSPLRLQLMPPLPMGDIVQTTRIGIRKAKEVPWRFYIKNNPYVSGVKL